MSVTIRDAETLAVLGTSVGVQDVVAPDGRVLGRFLPAPRPGMMFPEFGMTDDEVERHDNDPAATYVSADAVMARLRQIDGQG